VYFQIVPAANIRLQLLISARRSACHIIPREHASINLSRSVHLNDKPLRSCNRCEYASRFHQHVDQGICAVSLPFASRIFTGIVPCRRLQLDRLRGNGCAVRNSVLGATPLACLGALAIGRLKTRNRSCNRFKHSCPVQVHLVTRTQPWLWYVVLVFSGCGLYRTKRLSNCRLRASFRRDCRADASITEVGTLSCRQPHSADVPGLHCALHCNTSQRIIWYITAQHAALCRTAKHCACTMCVAIRVVLKATSLRRRACPALRIAL
jgi:hypothetical protein